ncbi:MAG TPA: GspH/FimT family pseudopilin [Marinagarivorans sp.]
MNSYKGVTLIEMMIVIAIAAILLAVAAPSFRSMVIRSNIDSLVDDFATAVITARTEAASRGREVMVCADDACRGTTWSDGWFVMTTDADGDLEQIAAFDNSSEYPIALKKYEGATESATTSIVFTAQGYNKEQSRYVFTACEPNTPVKIMRGVTVELSGRAYQTDRNGTLKEARFDKGDGNVETKDLGCS